MIVQYRMLQILEVVTTESRKLFHLECSLRSFPCRGQTTCRGSCDSGELGRNSGKFSSQIENTPILCPFHLQPVPEYDMFFKIFVSAKLFFSSPPPPGSQLHCLHIYCASCCTERSKDN